VKASPILCFYDQAFGRVVQMKVLPDKVIVAADPAMTVYTNNRFLRFVMPVSRPGYAINAMNIKDPFNFKRQIFTEVIQNRQVSPFIGKGGQLNQIGHEE